MTAKMASKMASSSDNECYHAVVDMGSNGIRFSISNLAPPTARVMPAVYQDRCDISLFDVQYFKGRKVPIPPEIIDRVVSALQRFKSICQDFGVPNEQIRIVATEATREALNSQDYRDQIETKTGWKVDMLAKEEEGRVGAMGIASSFSNIKGLALDLGGGSIQITWVICKDGVVETSPKGPMSFPYGAAALMNKLGTDPEPQIADKLQAELSSNLQIAIRDLELPLSILEDAKENGFTIYLSGGGFRGWGYILMSMHAIKPYPIPIINGFRVLRSSFLPDSATVPSDDSTFRVSSRRASQVPAVRLIITALARSLPNLATIYFAQGGVREGVLFSTLPLSIRSQNPLLAATSHLAPPSAQGLVTLLQSGIPPLSPHSSTSPMSIFSSTDFLTSIINLLFAHSSLNKDVRSAAALRSTTTGLLAGAHGMVHEERALIALVLCERWGGELSPYEANFRAALAKIVGAKETWWAQYIGRLAQGLGNFFPAGLLSQKEQIIELAAGWGISGSTGGKLKESSDGTNRVIRLDLSAVGPGFTEDVLDEWRKGMEKVGKKKKWVENGQERFGWRVEVRVLEWRE